jgi:hypothetical protein
LFLGGDALRMPASGGGSTQGPRFKLLFHGELCKCGGLIFKI